MRWIFANCVLAALLLAGAWADHHQHHHNHGSDLHHEDQMSCHKLSSPNADFAFALYRNLNAKTDAGKNIFYSPLGVSSALSMLSTGAAGDTHRQLFSTLGYGAFNQSQVNEASQHLFHMLGHSQENQKLDVGNAVAVRAGFNPSEKFLTQIKDYYSGHIFNVDLTKPAEAAAEINAYISNKTHDRIKDMVKDLDQNMVMMLINYVYFKGEWEKPFFPEFMTRKADFHVDDKTKVRVDMMEGKDDYNIYHDADNHTTIVMLPYKGTTSMMIVLPDEGKMKEVEGFISMDHLEHWRNSVSQRYILLYLPKFSISVDASLGDTLKELGITNAFEDNADFSGISDGTKIKVSKVSHKTLLTVNEMGTEAASVTSISIPMSLPPQVRINRPFLVFIMERSARSILFMGKISNPTLM